MKALPFEPGQDVEHSTALGCPNCPGVLAVLAVEDHLRFRCRIGHVYSLEDVIESKEQRLEDLLWAPVTALQEIATLLRELVQIGQVIGSARDFEARAGRALRHAEVIRLVIEENEKTRLGPPGSVETSGALHGDER